MTSPDADNASPLPDDPSSSGPTAVLVEPEEAQEESASSVSATDLDADDLGGEDTSTEQHPPGWWPFRVYPGDDEARRWVQRAISLLVVAACCGYVFWVVHPELILRNTTPTGGDMGAHVWGPAFLRDHLLPDFRLSGWTSDWYNGFPAYTFYMVVPSLAIVALDVGFIPWFLSPLVLAAVGMGALWLWRRYEGRLARTLVCVAAVSLIVLSIDLPYNIAFKLVAVSGLVTLPAGVWWLGHNLGLRFGGPELMAIASIPFLMDRWLFHIYGGNIASTMAGEFAFSISLSFGLFFLGTVARGTRTGKHVVAAGVLAALCALNHVIPAIYCVGAALVILAFRPTKRAFVWSAQVIPIGALLVSFWYLPFYLNSTYMNDMGWEKLGPLKNQFGANIFNTTEFWRYLLPFAPHISDTGSSTPDPDMLFGKVFFVLAFIGIALSIVKRVRAGLVLATILVLSAVAFRYMPQARFWNARVLPLYYLCIYLLAAIGVFLVLTVMSQAFVAMFRGARLGAAAATVGALYVMVLLGVEQVWPYLAAATAGERIALATVGVLAPLLVGLTARSCRYADVGPGLVTGLASVTVAVIAVTSIDAVDAVSSLQVSVGLVLAVGLLCGAVYLDVPATRAGAIDDWGPAWVSRLTPPTTRFASPFSSAAIVGMAVAVVFVAMGLTMRNLPGGGMTTDVGNPEDASDDVTKYEWGPFSMTYQGVARLWADYNFRGLEDKKSGGTDWSAEYFGVVSEVARVGREHGCGRMMWEYDGDRQNSYGTPMAFMMIPYFTDGCIGSQEGLYFEASATTPFHFLMQSELSAKCSCAQRFDIFGFQQSPYKGFDIDLGIRHMQMLGIRYYMADTDIAKTAASADPRLTEVGRYDPYVVYEVADTPIVRGLSALPEVWPHVPDDAHDRVGPVAQWFMDPSRWDVVPASDGPDEWPRNERVTPPGRDALSDADREIARASFTEEQVEEIAEAKAKVPKLDPLPEAEPTVEVRAAKVDQIERSNNTITFEVDEPGTPVLITESYFPNWQAEGAEGPWRVGPNMMVVVPTAEKVTLTYGRSGLELGSMGLSLLGILLVLWLLHRGELIVGREPRELAGDRDDPADLPGGDAHGEDDGTEPDDSGPDATPVPGPEPE